ncbi:TPA: hypothetical protein JRS25_003685 [Escherichia coli]|nr:hypothetical protein [Escherichia coli]HAY3976963.1 hypothetical protein [Escherichia coli]HBB9210934.1 hypothetical protein [Escherichia coli]
MVSSINDEVKNKLLSIYPDITIYDEKVPQKFKTPSFFISIYDQDYEKRLNTKYGSTISYDVSYFPNEEYNKNNEMYLVQENLLREFRDLGTFRALSIRANITDDVLHIIFDVKYSEMTVIDDVKMNKLESNTNIKEE